MVGTFGYMAPEQFQGRAMSASDVYAIGATALWLLTGREPEDLPHRGLGIDVPAALADCRVRPALVKVLSAMLVPAPDERVAALGVLVKRVPRFGAMAPMNVPWQVAQPDRRSLAVPGGRAGVEPRADRMHEIRAIQNPASTPRLGRVTGPKVYVGPLVAP